MSHVWNDKGSKGTNWRDNALKEFERDDKYMTKIFLEALDNDVKLDAQIEIKGSGLKLRAWCVTTKTYLQFPTKLRKLQARYIGDVVKSKRKSGRPFYRVLRGSIRHYRTGEIVG